MPIYEYRRPDGTTFDVIQSFSDEPLTTDPETGVPVERVLRPPAVHFKGKGFYNTDYGTRRRQRETAAAGEAGSGSDSGSSKSESSDGSGAADAGGKDAASSKSSAKDGASPAKKAVAAND
jgi:putative FmdB family regulatory protein